MQQQRRLVRAGRPASGAGPRRLHPLLALPRRLVRVHDQGEPGRAPRARRAAPASARRRVAGRDPRRPARRPGGSASRRRRAPGSPGRPSARSSHASSVRSRPWRLCAWAESATCGKVRPELTRMRLLSEPGRTERSSGRASGEEVEEAGADPNAVRGCPRRLETKPQGSFPVCEHPHRRPAGRDRPHRPDARRPAAREVDRGDVPRRRRAATTRCAGCTATPAPGSGERVSVQGSGMGQPSLAIYANELFASTTSAAIIRVGSCGALTPRARAARPRHRLGRLHRLLDEPDRLRGARLRAGRRLRPAPGGVRRLGRAGPTGSGDAGRARRADLLQRLVLRRPARADRADGGLRRAGGRDGGQRALHPGREVRPPGAGDLHGVRPHRHRRGDRRRRSASRPSATMVEIALTAALSRD